MRRLDGYAQLDAETGSLVALYARTLTAIEKARRGGNGQGDMAGKTTEELVEMALEDPLLRDALKRGA